MSILERLSSVRGERDNVADIALAEDIVKTRNKKAIEELVAHLGDKNKRLAGGCIKTLYEVGEREPKLISDYVDEFAALLTNKNQRLVWGAVTALDMAASANPEGVHAHLKAILKAAEGESVIARDHAVNILAKLCAAGHTKKCLPILFEIIRTCPVNQLPSYSERAAEVVTDKERANLASLVSDRLPEAKQYPAKQKRMEKVLRKLERS
jgi:hypothetical protein